MTDNTPEQLALISEAKQCWVDTGKDGWGEAASPENHCRVASTVDGRWYWSVHYPGDWISIGGTRVPLHTDVTPCNKHLPRFEELFGGE